MINNETIQNIEKNLDYLVFNCKEEPKINPGKDICVSNALNLYMILQNKYKNGNIHDLIYKSLIHKSYEVVLTILNYLLILYKSLDIDDKFQECLSIISDRDILRNLSKNEKYFQLLCNIIKNNKYIECIQKCLKLLTLENGTEKYIVKTKLCEPKMDDCLIINTLIDSIHNEHENLMHIYLESLSKFVSRKIREKQLKEYSILKVLRVMYECSSSDNSDETRSVVVGFLEQNFKDLLNMDVNVLSEEEQCKYCTDILYFPHLHIQGLSKLNVKRLPGQSNIPHIRRICTYYFPLHKRYYFFSFFAKGSRNVLFLDCSDIFSLL